MQLCPPSKFFRDTNLTDPVPLNPDDISYQGSDSDPPINTDLFKASFDSSEYGQSNLLVDLGGSSTSWIDANDLAGFQQQDIPIEQANDKVAVTMEDFIPFPLPQLKELLEPRCPAGKRAYCCSGGKAANNIGKVCSECTTFSSLDASFFWRAYVNHADSCPGSLSDWRCFLKYFTLCCKGYVVNSIPDFSQVLCSS